MTKDSDVGDPGFGDQPELIDHQDGPLAVSNESSLGAAVLVGDDSLGARVGQLLGGRSPYPLLVLFGFFLVDQIDSGAFNVLAPEIKAAFDLSAAGLGLLFAANFILLLGASVFVGYLGDRQSRVRLTIVLALTAVLGSVTTGLAPVLAVLVIARFVNGVGVVASQPVHRSLLADYYEEEQRGNLYAVHQSAEQLGAVLSPIIAGALGIWLGWRAVFIVLAVPIALIVLFALRLRDPVRGGTDDAENAMRAARERPPNFGQSVRSLAKIPTLRRTWLGLVFVGGGFVPLAAFLPLYFEAVFGLDLFARGVVGAVSAAFGIAGLLVAGRLVEKWQADLPGKVQAVSGITFIAISVVMVMFVLSAHMFTAAALSAVVAFIGGFYVPTSVAVQSSVSPPRLRTQAFAFSSLFLAAGAFLAPIAGGLADDHGLRVGLLAFTPLLAVGGAVLWSAAPFVTDDRSRARESLKIAAEMRRLRQEMEGNVLLACRGLDVSYGPVQVLFGVDFDVREGELVALLGTNGAGKSTLLKAISGLITPDRGQIFLDGDEIGGKNAWDVATSGVTYMPGGRAVFPVMTVEDNLRLAMWMRPQDSTADALAEVFELFPRLQERRRELAGNLSGGEQQMLSLAQSFITRPKLLMIDELSLGLAPKIVGELLDVVRQIHARGVTIVLVEQSVNVAMSIAERAYFMEKGEVRFSGKTSELIERPDILRSVFLEGASKAALIDPT